MKDTLRVTVGTAHQTRGEEGHALLLAILALFVLGVSLSLMAVNLQLGLGAQRRDLARVRLKDRVVAFERVSTAIRARLRPVIQKGHELTVTMVFDGEVADRQRQRPLIEHALDDPRLLACPGQRRHEQVRCPPPPRQPRPRTFRRRCCGTGRWNSTRRWPGRGPGCRRCRSRTTPPPLTSKP